jgi:hypothetical protein
LKLNNIYGLPEADLEAVRQRDKNCVYCHKEMLEPSPDAKRTDWATIEHLNHLPPWDNPKTIAICCTSCNSSRGNKRIVDWFESRYCKERAISPATVAQPVLAYIIEFEGYEVGD